MNYLVIKCGGSVFEELPATFYQNIVQLNKQSDCKPVIVHGGGPKISAMLEKSGVETTFVDGLRVTTEDVLDVVEMTLSGSMNKAIVRKLAAAGGQAYGISGVDGGLLHAVPATSSTKLGFVGEVSEVNEAVIQQVAAQGFIPVISPLGMDKNGQRYNINADTAAAAIAEALGAKLCFISDIPGIYQEINGEKITLEQVTKQEAETLIDTKVIQGGMIPKVRAALKALSQGIPEAAIVNGMEANSLTDYVEGKKAGTKIILEKEVRHV